MPTPSDSHPARACKAPRASSLTRAWRARAPAREPQTVDGTHEGLGPRVCLVFLLYSFIFGLITYGLALPSGLFVPCIMMGAALGRLVGETLGMTNDAETSPGAYALIGAAGMLGGVCRMTISITVIVVESTGNVTFMLPIAITIMLAKLVGDFFTEGIYDLHIHIKGYPFIRPDGPVGGRGSLNAADVMAGGVRTVCELEQVGTLVKLLRSTTHHGFPVTKSGGGGGVLGVILRDPGLRERYDFELKVERPDPDNLEANLECTRAFLRDRGASKLQAARRGVRRRGAASAGALALASLGYSADQIDKLIAAARSADKNQPELTWM